MGRVAGCFPRREPRLTCRNMVQGLLMVKDSANCWSLAEAIGHAGPHVLQHFLSRARFDTEAIRRSAAAWTVEQLGSSGVMLVVDETGDEKSSTDAVGAARQYSDDLRLKGLMSRLRYDDLMDGARKRFPFGRLGRRRLYGGGAGVHLSERKISTTEQARVKNAWTCIASWLRQYAPDSAAFVQPGATAGQIAAAEEQMSRNLQAAAFHQQQRPEAVARLANTVTIPAPLKAWWMLANRPPLRFPSSQTITMQVAAPLPAGTPSTMLTSSVASHLTNYSCRV